MRLFSIRANAKLFLEIFLGAYAFSIAHYENDYLSKTPPVRTTVKNVLVTSVVYLPCKRS